ncbi:unnamed protein product [Adineta ricciae]|uniref:G-protein coupled receptors family 1 profile domain-containing protein n=1 Tax=Adineta ricciae TaxID=249248 RepID=A0A813UAL9_ADIRI|nr:unnamed protein product [Adineta ricciae]CAF1163433.1 unnamed protein product [Adineta ricciae]
MVTFASTSILCVVCVCGVIGNAIILGIGISKRKYQKNVTNCFIMNLAITDLLFLLISVPLTMYLAMSNVWIFGEFMCKMHIYLAHVLLQATCYTLAAMSIDRYLSIVHDFWYRRYRTPKQALIICIFVWMISGAFMFPYDYLLHTDTDKHNDSSGELDCTVNDNSFFSSCMFTFTFYYVLPLLIIGLCYSRVFSHVRYHGTKIARQLSRHNSQTIRFKKRRVKCVLLGLTLAFALCWLPIHILELVQCSQILSYPFFVKHADLLTIARIFAHGLSYFNSCLNPFLYAMLNRSFFFDVQ